ncbi:MAG: hypothetical protein RTV31_10770 [Candidatus Thorarchaeota archaeon]
MLVSLLYPAFFYGFSIVFLIGYFIIRSGTEGKERLLECYVVMAVNVIGMQLLSIFLGILGGFALGTFILINVYNSPFMAIMFIDLYFQYKNI